MSFDVALQHAVATGDFTDLIEVLKKGSRIDIHSESFKQALQLSIQNGDETLFAELLRHIPQLTIRARSNIGELSRQRPVRREFRKAINQLLTGIATDLFSCSLAHGFSLLFYHMPSSSLAKLVKRARGYIEIYMAPLTP